MAIVPSSFVKQQEIEAALDTVAKNLAPDVVRIRFSLGQDWTGEDAIFFRVVLSDPASASRRLLRVTQRVTEAIMDAVQPRALGLEPYFNFRSATEQAELREEAWA